MLVAVIRVQHEWLITELPKDHAGNEVVGYLGHLDTPFARENLEKVQARFPNLNFSPFQLDAYYHYREEAYSLLGLAGLLIVAGAITMLYSRVWWRKARHARGTLP